MKPALMLPDDMQRANEYRFARHHIDGYVRKYIAATEVFQPALAKGLTLLTEWANTEFSYSSKNVRVAALRAMDLEAIVLDVVVASVYCQSRELYSSFCAKLAGILGFDDKLESVKTVAEIAAVLCETDFFDIDKNDKFDSLHITSNVQLPPELDEYIKNATYLPPLVCEPKKLTHNRDTPYLTIEDTSRILNKGHHSDDICLDAINIKNSIPLSLDTEFLCLVEEEPNSELDTPEKVKNWLDMKGQSYEFYHLMAQQGNKFYLDHKCDKRGRLYACGYHISTQGSPIKKAMVELHNKEVITDVPDEFRF